MMLVSLISYIDRNTLALLAPTILKETHLSARDYGFIVSAFSVAYMIGNPVWGSLLDRLGLRRGMTAAVSLWTVASAAHAFAAGFFSFAGARAVLGFGEGATFPGGLRTVIQTLPPELRSRGTALAYSGGSLGAVITPIVVTPIALRYGWRGAFWFTGFVGLCWIAWWLRMSRRPDVAHVAPSETASDDSRPRLGDPRIWSFTLLYSLGGLPIAFVLYGAALYLNQALGKTQAEIGKVLWIPPLGWEIGYFFWGWVTDGFARHGASPSRMRIVTALLTVLSLPLAVTGRIESFALALAVLSLAMFVTAGFVIVAVAYATNIYSTRNSGFLAGLGAGSWSAVVALVMPLFGDLFDHRRYDTAFVVAASCPVLGYLAWNVMNRNWR
jgi:ACS family hexuronate transporter-like MFS transporter